MWIYVFWLPSQQWPNIGGLYIVSIAVTVANCTMVLIWSQIQGASELKTGFGEFWAQAAQPFLVACEPKIILYG